MSAKLDVFKQYVQKCVKESVTGNIIKLITKGVFDNIIRECVESNIKTALKEALKEYNTKVNRTSFTHVDPDMEGIVNANEEPEAEKAPTRKRNTPAKQVEAMAMLKQKYAPVRDDFGIGTSAGKTQERLRESIVLDDDGAQQTNYDENTPSRLVGGSGGNLPHGDVNPAHLLKMLKENKKFASHDDLDSSNLDDAQIASLIKR